MNIVEKLAAENLLTDEQVERIGRSVSEVVKAAQEDPSLMENALKKLANPFGGAAGAAKGFLGTALQHAKEYAPWAVGSAIVGGGMTLGSRAMQSAYSGVKDTIQKSQAYDSMLEATPELHDANPDLVQKGFNTLFRFNPEFAKDPLVAGTFVKNVVDQERINLGDVRSLVDARKSMQLGGRDTSFFTAPPADIASKMHATSFVDPAAQADQERKARLGGLKEQQEQYRQQAAEADMHRARAQADLANAEAAAANRRYWAEEE